MQQFSKFINFRTMMLFLTKQIRNSHIFQLEEEIWLLNVITKSF